MTPEEFAALPECSKIRHMPAYECETAIVTVCEPEVIFPVVTTAETPIIGIGEADILAPVTEAIETPIISVPEVDAIEGMTFTVETPIISVPEAEAELILVDIFSETPIISVPEVEIAVDMAFELEAAIISVPEEDTPNDVAFALELPVISVPEADALEDMAFALEAPIISVPEADAVEGDDEGPEFMLFVMFGLTDISPAAPASPGEGVDMSWGVTTTLIVGHLDGAAEDWSEMLPLVPPGAVVEITDVVNLHTWDYEILTATDNEDGTFTFTLSLITTNFPFGGNTNIGTSFHVGFIP